MRRKDSPAPLFALSDRHKDTVPRLLADLGADVLAQADDIADATVLIFHTHIYDAAVIRRPVKCGAHFLTRPRPNSSRMS